MHPLLDISVCEAVKEELYDSQIDRGQKKLKCLALRLDLHPVLGDLLGHGGSPSCLRYDAVVELFRAFLAESDAVLLNGGLEVL